MSRISADRWQAVGQIRPTGEQVAARLAVPEVTRRLLCGIDAEGRRHFLITLEDADAELEDSQSRGLSVTTRELVVRGRPSARYLDIACCDITGHAVFDLIGSELAEELSRPQPQPADITRRVLARWRRFWGQAPRSLLSREQLLGLFAEVWFLDVWLLPSLGAADAVGRWRGPFRARHDFEWPTRSVEVKATSSTRGRMYRIHGLEQLLPPDHGELLLFGMRVREEGGATNALPALIAHTREELQVDSDAVSQFDAALHQAGYSAVHDEEYAKIRLRVAEERLFAVRDDFPRLTPQSFGGAAPPGVESVEYDVNLDAFDHLCLARSPAEANQQGVL